MRIFSGLACTGQLSRVQRTWVHVHMRVGVTRDLGTTARVPLSENRQHIQQSVNPSSTAEGHHLGLYHDGPGDSLGPVAEHMANNGRIACSRRCKGVISAQVIQGGTWNSRPKHVYSNCSALRDILGHRLCTLCTRGIYHHMTDLAQTLPYAGGHRQALIA